MEFQYRGLKADYQRHLVTSEEVERQLHRLQQQTPRIQPIMDRPTESGDEVVLDYAGFCKGVQFAGGTARNQTLVLGSGTFIPGFEEQLLDKVPGEEVIVKVTFPEKYHSEELAGQEAEFRCVINQIRIRSSYELDDTFAKEAGGVETFAEMQELMKTTLQDYADRRGEMDLQEQLLRQAAATLELEIAPEQLEKAMDEQLENMKAQLSQQGLSIEMYCQFMSTTVEALREEAKPEAENRIRTQAAVDKIVELEGLASSEEEIQAALTMICRQNNITMEELQKHYDEEFAAMVNKTILTGKVMELIRKAADVTVTED